MARGARRAGLAVCVAALGLLLGCQSPAGTGAAPPEDPGTPTDAPVPTEQTAGAWVVTDLVVDGKSATLLTEWPITLDVADGRVGGRGPCNHYGGPVTTDASGTFVVGEGLVQTEMACADEVMALEQTYLAALQRVDRAVSTGGLTLTDGAGEVVIVLGAAPPGSGAPSGGTSESGTPGSGG